MCAACYDVDINITNKSWLHFNLSIVYSRAVEIKLYTLQIEVLKIYCQR